MIFYLILGADRIQIDFSITEVFSFQFSILKSVYTFRNKS